MIMKNADIKFPTILLSPCFLYITYCSLAVSRCSFVVFIISVLYLAFYVVLSDISQFKTLLLSRVGKPNPGTPPQFKNQKREFRRHLDGYHKFNIKRS